MSYGDHTLDKTMAWFFTCLMAVLLALTCVLSQHLYQNYTIEREAIKSGYCEVANVPSTGYYHWEKCQPSK